MTINWQPLRDVIDANERFILSSHVRPDADALGSELAFAGILADLGKSVRIVNPSVAPAHLDFMDPDNRVLKVGSDISINEVCDTDVHIVLDTGAWIQLQDVGKALRKSTATKVVIDHHVSSDELGAMEFRDVKAEATGTLVFNFADACGLSLSPESAGFLYCAIATDTGWFRFPSTTGETMRIAGRLMDLGAEPPKYYRLLYERYSAARMKLVGRALSQLHLECDGRLAYIVVRDEDFRMTGANPSDTEDLVNECLRIAGTEAAFVAIEQNNHALKFSLRSRSELNVAVIAEQFGGGGHKQAAGAVVSGPIANALKKVRDAMHDGLMLTVN